ncbi:hypothetical protein ACV344_31020 [Pseudomonas aeruginosa]|uniref:hypothetical protein n=1 Tax=Pseudomonas aeruginosa TaxID=287 RepID=UPI000E67845B|nr:hypothetical protein [Pseudomonas aeruginosa]MBA5106249.1 hypothetical protein [Pseudomonas aeruginosa]MBD1300275.1 hypothetical protein [Pseudomonas aeruginosa]MBD1340744.1 hypothetical protein [Pseudomonas aeruginosa]MBH3593016.1 hypothetical protein [Pseudomonas aeruginosa]MCO2528946.1 hypothetical protein [Pseudomonas aeruginosa]
MDNEVLAYLAQRLEAVAKGPFCEAAVLVRKVIDSASPALQKRDAEHALYQALWAYVTQALDHGDYDQADKQAVIALESEMAGQVLSHRLARGWLCRSETGPVDFPGIEEFM